MVPRVHGLSNGRVRRDPKYASAKMVRLQPIPWQTSRRGLGKLRREAFESGLARRPAVLRKLGAADRRARRARSLGAEPDQSPAAGEPDRSRRPSAEVCPARGARFAKESAVAAPSSLMHT
jgi:hypothetical protein